MQGAEKRAAALQAQIDAAMRRLDIAQLEKQKNTLDKQSSAADFWNNPSTAQEVVRQQAKLERRISPWTQLQAEIRDIQELLLLQDESLLSDLESQLVRLEDVFDELKSALKFNGPYDDHDAIVSIYAGVGGTDAQDWAQMLYRMYVRWSEAHNVDVQLIDESAGEEAGLKSVTVALSGDFAYGKLKGEHGVHRLVRLSPFNADSLRQTSFAKVDVLPKIDQPDAVIIDDKDLRIDVYRSGGHGGQSVNTTDSAVRITHLPTGITVAIQNERSQLQNRETAMTILRSRLAQLQLEQHQDTISDLKGPNEQAAWGNQIRSYVLHPYKQVKDLRTRHETSDLDSVLNGELDPFIDAYLEHTLGES